MSVEKVVSTETIRQYSPLVTIPAYMVDAVCEIPHGAHPLELLGWVPEVNAYISDSEANKRLRQAVQSGEDGLNAWIKEWILDVPSHAAYLSKLGENKVQELIETASDQLNEKTISFSKVQTKEYSELEMMAVVAARKIEEVVLRGKYRFIQLGPGLALPATFLAYSSLRAEEYDVDVFVAWGHYGFLPRDSSFAGLGNLSTPKMYTSMYDIYSSFMSGAESPSLVILGLTEVDRYANVNLTRLEDGTELAGGGGHNDCAAGAGEVLMTGRMSIRRFRNEINFVTTAGDKIRTIVTDLGVLRKIGQDNELSLSSYYGSQDKSQDDCIAAIKKQCGWNLKVASDVYRESPPTIEELTIIRRFMQARGEADG